MLLLTSHFTTVRYLVHSQAASSLARKHEWCTWRNSFHLTSLTSSPPPLRPALLTSSSSSPCTLPFPSASSRRAALLSFSPFSPSPSVCSLCAASRLLLLLLALLLLFLLMCPPPSSSFFSPLRLLAPVLVPPATLGSSSSRDLFILFLLLICPSPPLRLRARPIAPFIFVEWTRHWERWSVRDKDREKERARER